MSKRNKKKKLVQEYQFVRFSKKQHEPTAIQHMEPDTAEHIDTSRMLLNDWYTQLIDPDMGYK